MSESECTIEDCPGCLMLDTVDKLIKMGLNPDDMMPLFFSALRERFDVQVGIVSSQKHESVVH